MSNSFSIALGALNATSTALTSVGNNLANMNTTGYKATTASFFDLVSQQLGVGATSSELGMGVSNAVIKHQFSQGALQSASNPFSAAIQGDGFFLVKNAAGNVVYTRAGDFHVDANGFLVDVTGKVVQGWNGANGVLTTSGAPSNIQLSAGALQAPIPTGNFNLNLNLDSGTANNGTFSTPIQVVDSLGQTHTLTVVFTKTGSNAWNYDVQIPGEDIQGGTAGKPQSVATGSMTFDQAGKLLTPAPPPPATNGFAAVKITNLADGAANQTINWNFYKSDLTPTITQFAATSAASGSQQDGLTAASPVKVQLGDNGIIIAQYANGKTLNVAQVALASIRNPESLVPIGENDYATGPNTSTPTVGVAGTGGRGQIAGGALESSTVDIATEFTNLMVFQRSYQANSKVITTLDELAQDTLNIKR